MNGILARTGVSLPIWLWLVLFIVAGLVSLISSSKTREVSAATPAPLPPPPGETTRVCPFCAETVKAAALVCRFCSRDLPPVTHTAPEPADLDHTFAALAASHPVHFPEARQLFLALPQRPDHPDEWLAELCKRMQQGAIPENAAQRIPLTWPN